MCDLFTASSQVYLVKRYFYYNIDEAIEHILIYSLIRQAFNKHLFHPVLEAGDTKVNKTWGLFSRNSPFNKEWTHKWTLLIKRKKCLDRTLPGSLWEASVKSSSSIFRGRWEGKRGNDHVFLKDEYKTCLGKRKKNMPWRGDGISRNSDRNSAISMGTFR